MLFLISEVGDPVTQAMGKAEIPFVVSVFTSKMSLQESQRLQAEFRARRLYLWWKKTR